MLKVLPSGKTLVRGELTKTSKNQNTLTDLLTYSKLAAKLVCTLTLPEYVSCALSTSLVTKKTRRYRHAIASFKRVYHPRIYATSTVQA